MPIYEYNCPKCQNKFELLRPLSKSNEAVKCPKCSSLSTRTISKFVSRAKDDLGSLTSFPESGGSCGSCTSSSCSTCGQ